MFVENEDEDEYAITRRQFIKFMGALPMITGSLQYQYNPDTNTLTFIPGSQDRQSTRKYFSPIGTEEERATDLIWPGKWLDVNAYNRWYYTGSHWAWHTGADLNLNAPAFDSDAHAPIYSIADGYVYAVRKYSGWDKVICIEHEDVLSRYAHVENVQISEGQQVKAGQHIANVGNAGGNYPYHLHFDITRLGARMKQYPGDWPRENRTRVLQDYLDPKTFLLQHI